MYARAFDVLSITRSGRIIHRQQDSLKSRSELLYDQAKYRRGHLSRCSPHARQAIVEPVPIVLYSSRGKPGTGGTSIVGQKHPGHDDRQPKGDPAVHHFLQHGNCRQHHAGQGHFGFACFLAIGVGTLKPPAFVMLRLLVFLMFGLRTLPGLFIFSHPWLSCCGVSSQENRSIGRVTFSCNTNSDFRHCRTSKYSSHPEPSGAT